jgi:hypothetical protein
MSAADWQTFYAVAGGAAAVLIGLIFVAVSLHTDTIMGQVVHRDRAWASVALLSSQLGIALFVLIPTQPLWLLGLQIDLVAGYWVVRTIRVPARFATALRTLDRPLGRWQFEWVLWILWLVSLIAAGVTLTILRAAPVGFGLLGAAMLGMFGFAIWNAWVLVSEVSE